MAGFVCVELACFHAEGFPVIPSFQFISSGIAEEATGPLVSLNSYYILPLLRAKGSKTLNLGPDILRIIFKLVV